MTVAQTDLKTETILVNVKGYLAAIATTSDYWHTAQTVRRRHLPEDQVAQKSLPLFSVQAERITEGDEFGGLGAGRKGQALVFSIRGYNKIDPLNDETADTEAQRLIKDIGRCVFSHDGLGCQSVGSANVVEAIPLIDSGRPGFVGASVTFSVNLEVIWNE